MANMFASAILAFPDSFSSLSGDHVEKEFNTNGVLFNEDDMDRSITGWIMIVGRIIADFLPQLGFVRKFIPADLTPPGAKERAEKTEVISLPVKNLNESSLKVVVKIMEYYEQLALIIVNGGTQSTVQIGGDQLTAMVERQAKSLRKNVANPQDRFEELAPVTIEFFHVYMNYLDKMIYNNLWKDGKEKRKKKSSVPNASSGAVSPGTLKSLAEIVGRDGVNPNDTRNHYQENKRFFEAVFRVHVAAAFMDFGGIQDANSDMTKHAPPDISDDSALKKWTLDTLELFVRKYVFPSWNSLGTDSVTEGRFSLIRFPPPPDSSAP